MHPSPASAAATEGSGLKTKTLLTVQTKGKEKAVKRLNTYTKYYITNQKLVVYVFSIHPGTGRLYGSYT